MKIQPVFLKVQAGKTLSYHGHSLLLRRFGFCTAEASAKRVTGDEPQGTMGRVQTAGEPSRLPLRAHFHQKRDVWVRGSHGHALVTIYVQFLYSDWSKFDR